ARMAPAWAAAVATTAAVVLYRLVRTAGPTPAAGPAERRNPERINHRDGRQSTRGRSPGPGRGDGPGLRLSLGAAATVGAAGLVVAVPSPRSRCWPSAPAWSAPDWPAAGSPP